MFWIRALPAKSVVMPSGIRLLSPALMALLTFARVRLPLSAGSPVKLLVFVPLMQLKSASIVTAQAEKRSVIKGEMTVGGKWVDIRRANLRVNERFTSA